MHPPRHMRALSLLAILIAAGCHDRAVFEPTNPTTRGHAGQPAASYDIRHRPEAEPEVTVNVWSRGASEEDDRTFVDLVLEIRNTGDQTVSVAVDELRLDAFGTSGQQLPPAQLVRTTTSAQSVAIPPGEASTVELRFAMSGPVDPDRIASMRLRWAIDHQAGQYVQFTEFQQVPEQVATGMIYYDPVWGYYDPFLFGAPYHGYHVRYRVPVERVIVRDHRVARPRQHARRR